MKLHLSGYTCGVSRIKSSPLESQQRLNLNIMQKVCCDLPLTQKKERNVLFNDALNTFYLRLYGIGHMVKDHRDNQRGNLLPALHGLLFLISSKIFYMHHTKDRIAYTSLCYTSHGTLLERKIAQWVGHEESI